MSVNFEELDYQKTELGELSLRRRQMPSLPGIDVFEIKLNESFLMSSLFTTVEVALAELALAELQADQLDVVVGGLGLGYTARAALENPAVKSVLVIEALGVGSREMCVVDGISIGRSRGTTRSGSAPQ